MQVYLLFKAFTKTKSIYFIKVTLIIPGANLNNKDKSCREHRS